MKTSKNQAVMPINVVTMIDENDPVFNRKSYSKTDREATFMRMKDDHMENEQRKEPAEGTAISLRMQGMQARKTTLTLKARSKMHTSNRRIMNWRKQGNSRKTSITRMICRAMRRVTALHARMTKDCFMHMTEPERLITAAWYWKVIMFVRTVPAAPAGKTALRDSTRTVK